jgi:trans-2,3-dihydro-3-hydroxyanthranilate isomerase
MPEYNFAIYNAFSETTFGGSPAGIIADAQDLNVGQMQRIAREVGAPATCFIVGLDADGIDARFFSTQTEYLMCGHGSIALMTWAIDQGIFQLNVNKTALITLRTAGASSVVEIHASENGRARVMLPLSAATFEPCSITDTELGELFGINTESFDPGLPVEITRSDFTHLVVAIRSLETMQKLTPDFTAIKTLSQKLGVDTVALYTGETVLPESTIHSREFCPAVGTPEAPATGTTNRALACYLLRHDLLESNGDPRRNIIAEQGFEMGRPSRVCTEMIVQDGRATDIRVGGLATKTMEGKFFVS